MARILVTGASGFIGAHVVRGLAARGMDVLAVGRDEARLAAIESAAPVAIADLASDRLDPLMRQVDAVVHCAALSTPWGRFDDFHRANVQATERLLQAAMERRVPRFVHFSSPSIYFRLADQFDLDEHFVPPRRWINAYAKTKWLSEQCVVAPRHSGMTRIVLRPRAVFGEGDRAIFPRILKLAERGWFPYVGGGRAMIDTTYVGNVVDAVVASLATPEAARPLVCNISNGEPMAVRELLEKLFAALHMQVRGVPLSRGVALGLGVLGEAMAHVRPGKPEPKLSRYGVGVLGYSQTLDISRARDLLGYRPCVTVEEGIRRFARWWAGHREDRHEHA